MTRLRQQELDEIYAFAVDLGKRAGKLLLDGVERRIDSAWEQDFAEKDNAVDIVTKTDEGIYQSLLFCLIFHRVLLFIREIYAVVLKLNL